MASCTFVLVIDVVDIMSVNLQHLVFFKHTLFYIAVAYSFVVLKTKYDDLKKKMIFVN